MLFGFLKQKRQEKADDQQHWRARWQSLVPEENRSVPVTVDGQTRIAYIQINQFVVMLQDGLLMKAHFFDVCEFFQKAGYHVVWLMRCVQDVEGGYLKLVALFYTLCFTGNTFAGYFNGIGQVSVPFLGATSHIALRVVLSWLLVNALWTFVKWRMEKKQKAAERDIM